MNVDELNKEIHETFGSEVSLKFLGEEKVEGFRSMPNGRDGHQGGYYVTKWKRMYGVLVNHTGMMLGERIEESDLNKNKVFRMIEKIYGRPQKKE